jgi:hypothetical protein
MGVSSTCLPEHFLEKLFPEERKRLGQKTNAEAQAVYERREERTMHAHFANWLGLRQITFVESAMHKRSTIQEGHPDFTILFNNFNLCIEFKVKGGHGLSEVQKKRIDELRRCGNKVVVCYSLEEAILVTKQHFDL